MRDIFGRMVRDWRFHLTWITILAIVLRSIPAWIYSGWGNDFGIYYSITIEFLDKKNPLYDYPASWGSSGYGEFPVFYMIILCAYFITGADPRVLVLRVPPIIGGLTVIPLFLIAYYLTGNRKLSLIAALLLAINPIHMYQTSMPYFLTIGHFFMLFSLYFFIRLKDGNKWLYLLVPFSALLILSHHLTTYIFIISMLGIWFILSITGNLERREIDHHFAFISIYSFATFGYWILRVDGMKSFLAAPYHGLLPWYTTPIFYAIVLIVLRHMAQNLRLDGFGRHFQWVKRVKISWIFAISLSFGMFVLIALAVFGLHGFYIPLISVFYSLPFLLTIGFMGVGLFRLYTNERLLLHIAGWLLPIVLSALVGLLTWSLVPWRHVEYMMEPLSIVGALGIIKILESDSFNRVDIKKTVFYTLEAPFHFISHAFNPELSGGIPHTVPMATSKQVRDPVEVKVSNPVGQRLKIMFASMLIFIVVMTGITAYPFMDKVAPPEQQVSDVVMSGILYLAENGNRNYTVATSHKVGTIVSAYGFNSSFEYDYKIWNYSNWVDCLDELTGLNGTYPPIGYVIITRNMRENGVYGYRDLQIPIGHAVYMTNESYEKFKHEPFELIFANYTEDMSDWVEVYSVNWTYIENYLSERNITLKNMESGYTPWNSHRDFLNFSISCSSEFSRSLFTSIPAIFIMNSRDFR